MTTAERRERSNSKAIEGKSQTDPGASHVAWSLHFIQRTLGSHGRIKPSDQVYWVLFPSSLSKEDRLAGMGIEANLRLPRVRSILPGAHMPTALLPELRGWTPGLRSWT